ncbi:MAG TPA: HIT family protein [Dysgonamonadaceae bacterium]|jgi:histidine triad (HIT) family protein|nr:HIT family protein [Dysgonamonadaceae bacterium]
MSTVFTKIVKGEIPSYKIYEDNQFYAFLDINPLAKGHTLVIPKMEVDYLFDLEDELLSEMIVVAKKIAKAIEKSITCNRVGLMVIGLEVPHAHIHLIPILQEGDMNLSNERIDLSNKQFEDIAKKISSFL